MSATQHTREEFELLQDELKSINEERSQLSTELTKQMARNKRLQSDFDNKSSSLKAVLAKLEASQAKLKATEEALEAERNSFVQQRVRGLGVENKKLKEELRALNQEVLSLNAELEERKYQLEEAHAANSRAESLERENQILLDELSQLKLRFKRTNDLLAAAHENDQRKKGEKMAAGLDEEKSAEPSVSAPEIEVLKVQLAQKVAEVEALKAQMITYQKLLPVIEERLRNAQARSKSAEGSVSSIASAFKSLHQPSQAQVAQQAGGGGISGPETPG